MTIETNGVDSPVVEENQQAAVDAALAVERELASKSIEDQLIALKASQADAIKTRDAAKRKLREIELANEKTVAQATSYKERLVNKAVTDSLKQALADAGVLSVETALKLIDKKAIALNDEFEADQESIKKVVAALTVSDSILFKAKEAPTEADKEDKQVTTPAIPIKRASDKSDLKDAYAVAISSCKTMQEIQAVRNKFGYR